jgi:hypothetical protein
MFALAARLTGQVFTPEWLKGEFVAVPLVRWARRGDADGRLLLPELDEELGDCGGPRSPRPSMRSPSRASRTIR